MADAYLPAALDKRIDQARKRVKDPHPTDSEWTIGILNHLADEAEAAQTLLLTLSEPTPLPTDEDGHIQTSAEYGETHLVRITYNTDPEGKWVDGTIDASNQTLHGPFESKDEAESWIIAYPDGDTDVADMEIIVLNKVRP
jgi:hypothetical protein